MDLVCYRMLKLSAGLETHGLFLLNDLFHDLYNLRSETTTLSGRSDKAK